ncbi:MAG TPA: hypothetical protein VD813_09810 [Pseudonocardia sp.]|nr:hypothetical protein [Pseudonocardia sp.]
MPFPRPSDESPTTPPEAVDDLPNVDGDALPGPAENVVAPSAESGALSDLTFALTDEADVMDGFFGDAGRTAATTGMTLFGSGSVSDVECQRRPRRR